MKPHFFPFLKFFFVFACIGFAFFSCQKNAVRTVGQNQNAQTIKDVQYDSNTDSQGNRVNLTLDSYKPAHATAADRVPLVLFVHGGGYVGGDKSSSVDYMEIFAASGY